MAAFYIDHDVADEVAYLLRSVRHRVVTVRELRTIRNKDSYHLLTAAQDGRTVVTHNRRDYALLHDAWIRWSSAWSVTPIHAGILLLPHGQPQRTFGAIDALLSSGQPLTNELYEWTPSAGWVRGA